MSELHVKDITSMLIGFSVHSLRCSGRVVMGAGAATCASALLAEGADDEALLSVLCRDVNGARRLLRQAERLLSLDGRAGAV